MGWGRKSPAKIERANRAHCQQILCAWEQNREHRAPGHALKKGLLGLSIHQSILRLLFYFPRPRCPYPYALGVLFIPCHPTRNLSIPASGLALYIEFMWRYFINCVTTTPAKDIGFHHRVYDDVLIPSKQGQAGQKACG